MDTRELAKNMEARNDATLTVSNSLNNANAVFKEFDQAIWKFCRIKHLYDSKNPEKRAML